MKTDESRMREIATTLRIAFDSAKSKSEGAIILGFAVLTNDDATMFVPVVGAKSGERSEIPEDDLQFLPTYWDVTAPGSQMEIGHKILNELYEECNDYDNDENWHEQFRSRAYSILVNALDLLRSDQYFSPLSPEPFVTVWVVDSDLPNIRGRSWARRLNSRFLYQRFVTWLDEKWGAA